MKQTGVDYNDPIQVQVYEARLKKFKDREEVSKEIINLLGLKRGQSVIDMGVGTGVFALYAAKHCKKIYAADVSEAMLDYCRQKAKEAGLENIEFCHAGFLTYEHRAEPVDAVVSQVALHHLPDFWKLVGLQRLANMLKDGGKLYLRDQVYSFETADYPDFFDNWVKNAEQNVDEKFAREIEQGIRDEYITLDWIMEGILERAGFKIEKADCYNAFGATYLCTKRLEEK